MALLIDTNVLIDLLADRQPFSVSAGKLFTLCLNKNIKIFISAISFNNIYYILKQNSTHKETIKYLTELSAITAVVDLTMDILTNALTSEFKDFEDAIQYYSALTNPGIDKIITRNTKDFKLSEIAVMTPDEVLSILQANSGS